jgi:hypothetical protein
LRDRRGKAPAGEASDWKSFIEVLLLQVFDHHSDRETRPSNRAFRAID